MRQAEAFACIVRLLCLFSSGGCTAGEVDLDFDALVQLLRHLDLLRSVRELGGELPLRGCNRVILDELELCGAAWDDSLERLAEVSVQSEEVLLERLLLLVIELG